MPLLHSGPVPPADSAAPDAEDYPRLLSLAAHELRTPVSVVAGYIRMLQREGEAGLSERQRRILDEAARSCERLAALVNELSDIAKIDADTAAVARDRFDVFPLVAEAADAARSDPAGGAGIAMAGDEAGAEILGDRARLKAALSTIVRTVLREQAAPEIVIHRQLVTAPSTRAALVVVASSADAARLSAAPRARLDEHRGGLGLALPIARRIVERHGGEVWAPAGDGGQAARGAILVRLPCHGPRA